ncbi:glycosyltransferase [Terriglobus aquaticus]|uniref:Glycosyltransferase n=1 Tax=Terriglobus aquaticus TaxID=940139 RepID=A0ABW9KHR7_9BACT|nr:glycosyltransferase [Terriglobus aquaticus]
MKPPIGFVLVTHTAPAQAIRLCHRLNHMFGDPPIAIHHDFGKAALNRADFPANVRFVDQWVNSGWGTIGVVDSLMAALRLLYTDRNDGWGDPDWFVSLSAADYPIQTAEHILHQLQNSSVDGYLDNREITYASSAYSSERPGGAFPFAQPRYQQLAFRRYVAIPYLPYTIARRFDVPAERYCFTAPWLIRRFTPFHDGLRCFAGDAWMTMRRKVAHLLLANDPTWQRLHRHFASRPSPEEAIYHTFLLNRADVRLDAKNLRYTDWRGQHAHPRTLGEHDVPLLLRSADHFARKFPDDAALLQRLDQQVEQHSTSRAYGMHPSVSVIIPSYNCARYLPRAIESALAQTYTDLEVIVVDDGSTDNTAEVIQPYLDRIRYIRQANKGLPGARNTGIRASQSEFVALLDADDAWLPDKLERQMPRFQDPAVTIVFTDLSVEYADGSTKPSFLAERPLTCEGDVTDAYIQSRFLFPSAMVFRRDAMEACRLFDETMLACEDVELFTKMTLRGKVAWVNEPLMIRTEGTGQNITGNGEKLQNYLIRAFHSLLGNEPMPQSTRRIMHREIGLNYFYRGYTRWKQGKPGARHDLLQAIRFGPQVRLKALRTLLATYLTRSGRAA